MDPKKEQLRAAYAWYIPFKECSQEDFKNSLEKLKELLKDFEPNPTQDAFLHYS
jgi:hypothetical protein